MQVKSNHAHTRASRWSWVAGGVPSDKEDASLSEICCEPVRIFHLTYNNLTHMKVLQFCQCI